MEVVSSGCYDDGFDVYNVYRPLTAIIEARNFVAKSKPDIALKQV